LFIQSLIEIGAEHDEQDEATLAKWVDAHELKKIDEVWYKNSRRVVTNVRSGTRAVIAAHHDAPVHGHPGIARTIQLIKRDSWWPGLQKEVTDYVKGCAECQRHKVNNRPTRAPLEPIWAKLEAMPFKTIALDFITKLPVSQGCNSILTVTDHDCSKATIFIPCVEEISGEETAALYAKHVFARYGLPTKVISDRDPLFTSKFTRELCKRLGIQQNISTAYHPHTDGQSERSNQWLEQYLRFWVNERQDDWAQYLPLAKFAHNNWPNKSTRKLPFHVLMGYHPRADYSGAPSTIPRVNTRLEQYNEARRKAQDLMKWAQQSWVQCHDTPKYKAGDQVWLEGRHLQTNQPTAKLAPKRHGPFEVVQVMSPVNYRLKLPTQWSIHDVFHTDLLTPYRETPTHGANYQRPPPDLVDGVEEYEVERVLDSHRYGRGRKLQYLIAWKGYPDSDNQWVNWDDAEGAEDAIREFKCSSPDREIHIKASITSPCLSSHSRISSMSASPTSTCHFTIDTPENCEAWDEVVCSDSYFTPAVTYGDNNNVDDAATYNDHRRGRRSPGLASDILDATTPLRDMAEPETGLSSGPSPLQRDEAVSRPPLLEDGITRVGRRLPVQGLRPTGTQASAAGQSAGHTPYPNTAILFESSDDEDDDIKCGRCENPITYCHCSPTMLPPRTNKDEDNEEAKIPSAEGSDKENRLVEVRVGRGVGREADERGRVQEHRSRMYAPGTPQRATCCSLSPTPDGFVRNRGQNYVPLRIPTTNGRGVVTAKWVKIRMGLNPVVWGCMYKGGVVYQGDVHATPDHDHGPMPDYSNEQLLRLRSDYHLRHEVDEAIVQIGDQSLAAKVARYRTTMDGIQRIQKEIREKEDELYCLANTNCKSVGRLAAAHALARIAEEEMISNGLMVITPWVMERGCSG
jgi:hypothetical protein